MDPRRALRLSRYGHRMLGHPEKLFEFRGIEANHGLPINEGDRRGPETQLNQFFEGLFVGPDVLRHELNALLRKKLLLSVTRASPGLCVHNDVFCHGLLLVWVGSNWISF